MKRTRWIDGQIGARFGLLTVLAAHPTTGKYALARVRCDCGNEKITDANNIRRGLTQSCGCKQQRQTHGACYSNEYAIWCQMKSRCNTPSHPEYHNYGARGIKVCEQWMSGFENFLSDMGKKPPGLSLDRYPNNDGNYEPGNCRWATSEQQCNNLRKNRRIEFQGECLTVAQWARKTGIVEQTIRCRLRAGDDPATVLSPTTFKGRRSRCASRRSTERREMSE